VAKTACPKCGFHQETSEECGRCGIVFKRYSAEPRYPEPVAWVASRTTSKPKPVRRFRRYCLAFHVASLAFLILVCTLILSPVTPPQIVTTPDAQRRAEAKVREFQSSVEKGYSETLEMDEAELNGWLSSNLALRPPAEKTETVTAPSNRQAVRPAETASEPASGAGPTLEEAQSSVRDVRIELLQDSLRAYVLFELYGKDMSLELEGQLKVRAGCLRLEPTSGKLGSLPLPSGSLEDATKRLFDSPENREKFRLPLQIQDVKVEAGRLIVSSR
jgi:hypothetical protein